MQISPPQMKIVRLRPQGLKSNQHFWIRNVLNKGMNQTFWHIWSLPYPKSEARIKTLDFG